MRNSAKGQTAKEAGNWFEIRYDGEVKMTSQEEPKKGTKRKKKQSEPPKPAPIEPAKPLDAAAVEGLRVRTRRLLAEKRDLVEEFRTHYRGDPAAEALLKEFEKDDAANGALRPLIDFELDSQPQQAPSPPGLPITALPMNHCCFVYRPDKKDWFEGKVTGGEERAGGEILYEITFDENGHSRNAPLVEISLQRPPRGEDPYDSATTIFRIAYVAPENEHRFFKDPNYWRQRRAAIIASCVPNGGMSSIKKKGPGGKTISAQWNQCTAHPLHSYLDHHLQWVQKLHPQIDPSLISTPGNSKHRMIKQFSAPSVISPYQNMPYDMEHGYYLFPRYAEVRFFGFCESRWNTALRGAAANERCGFRFAYG